MKKTVSILAFIILFKISYGQDTIRRFEFGSTIFTMNSFNIASQSKSISYSHFGTGERPLFELINGLFFRFTKNRLALRVHASYSDFSSASTFTTDAWPYGPIGGNINNKDFRIGAGCQFSILEQRHCIVLAP